MSSEKSLNNLIINKVENQTVYDYMKTNGLINADELYLIEGTDEIDVGEATETESGLMSPADKVKLNGVQEGAEANQNAFSNVVVGDKIATADNTTDSFTFVAGNNITLTLDEDNNGITIDAKDTTYDAAGANLGLVKTGGDVTIVDGVITVNDDSHDHIISNIDGLQEELDSKVPTTRTVNGKSLNTDIELNASDVGALPDTTVIPSIEGLATEAYVDGKLDGIIDSAPDGLNTLGKLSKALGDDPEFSTTVTAQLNGKVDKVEGKDLSTNDYTDADKEKLLGIEPEANKYVHPNYTERSNGLYKVTVDETGHVSDAVFAEKSDIVALGIPAQDTTYGIVSDTEDGLMSFGDKIKLDNIEDEANKTIVDNALSDTSENPVQNKVINEALALKADKEYAMEVHQEGELLNTLPDGYWYSIAYGAGKYVIVSDDGWIYYSTDLKSWTEVTDLPVDYIECQKILYGNGKFVIIPYWGTEVLYSTDGVNWTATAFGSTTQNAWYEAIFENGKFIALGCNDSQIVAYSDDGITWSYSELPKSSNWRGVAYGNGKYVLSGSDSSTNFTLWSEDLVTWNEASLPITASFSDIAFGNGMFVMINDNSTDYVYSNDAITWTQGTMPVSASWECIEFGKGVFSVLTDGDAVTLSSTDGINWDVNYTSTPLNFIDLVYTNDIFIGVVCVSTYLAYSYDGIHWSKYLVNDDIEVTQEVATILTPRLQKDNVPTKNSINLLDSNAIYNEFAAHTIQSNIILVATADKVRNVSGNPVLEAWQQISSSKHRNIYMRVRIVYDDTQYFYFTLTHVKYDTATTSEATFVGHINNVKYFITCTYDHATDKCSGTLFIDPAIPKSTSITLASDDWAGDASPYSQVVTISSVTENSKIDLLPTAQQIVDLQNQEIQLMVENNVGTCTCYAIGGKPTSDLDMQVLITEVLPV